MKYYEEVRIVKVNRGYIVHVGCQTFVSSSIEEVFKGLKEYWDDPVEARKKYEEDYNDSCTDPTENRPIRSNR